MREITIVAFNYGNAGRVVNGPGMCLVNFTKKLRAANIKVNLFTHLPSKEGGALPISNFKQVSEAIKRSDVLHHWSGLDDPFIRAINFANQNNKKVVIGPNVLDLVSFAKEVSFLKKIKADLFFTVNERLRFLLSRKHSIDLNKIKLLLVGPDEKFWKPIPQDNGKVLWKGNSKQFVKDVNFGLAVAKKLDKYQFEFIGYPQPYDYYAHIDKAKSCHLYFTTSLSETMSLTLVESWMAGLPSISHPKIYLHGENYQTGIITNRDVGSYCEAIEEVMENEKLYQQLSQGAQEYVRRHFSDIHNLYVQMLGLK